MSPGLQFWIECALKSSLLMCAAFAVTALMRSRSAASRHVVWVAAFLGTLVVPATQALAPSHPLIVEHSAPWAPVAPVQFSDAVQPIADTRPVTTVHHVRRSSFQHSSLPSVEMQAASPPAPAARAEIDWPRTAIYLWLSVALPLLAYRAAGGLLAMWLRRNASSFDLGLNLADLAERAGVGPNVTVMFNGKPSPDVPMTWGVRRPVVMLPGEARSWPEGRMRSVLLHEFAHIRRFDVLTQAFSWLACSLYWFNPLLWLGARSMRAEAEAAADNFVLSVGQAPTDYADDLVRIAAGYRPHRSLVPVPGVTVMKSSKIESRIQAILDPNRPRRGATGLEALVIAAAISLLVAGTASIRLKGAALSVGAAQEASSHKGPYIKAEITHGGYRYTIYVIRVGDNLRGYHTRTHQGGRSAGGTSGNAADLTSWKMNDLVGLIEPGVPLEPFQMLDPAYRKLMEGVGFEVSQTDSVEVRHEFNFVEPPDLKEQRQEFIDRAVSAGQGKADEYDGPTITFNGDVVDVLKMSSRPVPAPVGDATTSKYWKLDMASGGMVIMHIVHLEGNKAEVAEINGHQQGIDRFGSMKDPRNLGWLFTQTIFPSSGDQPMNLNGCNFVATWINDPQYRQRLESQGIHVTPLDTARAEALWRCQPTPELELAVKAASQKLIADFSRPPTQMPISHFRTPVQNNDQGHGTIEVNGKVSQVFYTAAVSPQQPVAVDTEAAKQEFLRADQAVGEFAPLWARATADRDEVQAKFQSSGDKTALADAMDKVEQVHSQMAAALNTYMEAARSYDAATGGTAMPAILQKLNEDQRRLEALSNDADARFAKEQISDYDKELAEDRESIAHRKLMHLRMVGGFERRARVSQPVTQRPTFKPVTIEAQDEPIEHLAARLSAQCQVPIELQAGVKGNVSIKATNVPLETVLHTVGKQVNVRAIVVADKATLVPFSSRKGLVSFDEKDVDSRQVIGDMTYFADVKIKYANDMLGSVTLNVKDVPVEVVLDKLCAQIHAVWTKDDQGVYQITRPGVDDKAAAVSKPQL